VTSNYNYPIEKFTLAVRALTLGAGDVKDRLHEAYKHFYVLNDSDFPDELKADYQWIKMQLLKKPALVAQEGTQVISGSVQQTLHFMRRNTGVAIATRIVQLRNSLIEHNSNSSQSLLRKQKCQGGI
jgi:hypothetical protein